MEVAAGSASQATQSLAITVLNRMIAVGQLYCNEGYANTPVNVTGAYTSFAVANINLGGGAVGVNCGYGIQVVPRIANSLSGDICVASVTSPRNFMPQQSSTASEREFLEQAGGLPDFNLPVLSVMLPAISSTTPLSILSSVQFLIPYPGIALDPALPFLGLQIAATFYRFVPGGGGSSSGTWSVDNAASAVVTENTINVTYDLAASSVSTETSPYFLLSGTYAVTQIIQVPPLLSKDYWLAYFTAIVVGTQLFFALIGRCVDSRIDAVKPEERHDEAPPPPGESRPAVEEAAAGATDAVEMHRIRQPSAVNLHRLLTMFSRRPLHPSPTLGRVLSFYSFVSSVAIFSLLVLLHEDFDHNSLLNIGYGAAAAVLASPFAVPTRLGLQRQFKDYPSGLAAVLSMLGAIVALTVKGPIVATYVVVGVAVVAYGVSAYVLRDYWTLETQGAGSTTSLVVGLICHVVVTVASTVYLLYTALVSGTPSEWRTTNHYFQTLGWAIAIDTVVVEIAKVAALLAVAKQRKKLQLQRQDRQRRKLQDAQRRQQEAARAADAAAAFRVGEEPNVESEDVDVSQNTKKIGDDYFDDPLEEVTPDAQEKFALSIDNDQFESFGFEDASTGSDETPYPPPQRPVLAFEASQEPPRIGFDNVRRASLTYNLDDWESAASGEAALSPVHEQDLPTIFDNFETPSYAPSDGSDMSEVREQQQTRE
jgi:hypothetical protein